MLSLVKQIMKLSGKYKPRLRLAIFLAFFEGIFTMVPEFLVIITVFLGIKSQLTIERIKLLAFLLVLGILLRVVFHRAIDGLQSGTGYKIFADERMRIGEHLKRLPMGYFSDGTIGDVTAIVTSDILFVEMYGMQTIAKIVNAYISMILGSVMMLIFDWRIGIVAIITFYMGYKSLKKMDNLTHKHSVKRQDRMGVLIGTVIEFVKGISVIKAFNLKGKQMAKVDKAFRDTRDTAIDFEKKFAVTYVNFNNWFALGVSVIILTTAWFIFGKSIDASFGLMILIYVFQFFSPFQVLGSVNALARIMEAALERYNKVIETPIIDEDSKDVEINSYDIAFKNVSFAYEDEKVINNISFNIPENSMTALVGKSGCGKSTITSLIARFWDVQEGEVLVGGVNIKEMTCDSLLKNISMVFQNVYLFNDTILNNIKFGNPSASTEEVIEACKKARCYDFIMNLENGFETMIDEGGSSLSGGEKQRISIARAILKDAPIVLLDEATASVDPDNEKFIQEAISELVRNKTLVVIAHKLRTIKNANQILVIEKGEIIEQGNHEALINNDGLYKKLWERRTYARQWTINNSMR